MKLLRSLSALLLSLFVACPVNAASNPLGRFVVVGDSLTAGFQNFSLFTSSTIRGVPPGGQEYGYAQAVAQQAGTDLRNPKVLYPGIPPALMLDSAGHIIHAAGLGFRLNPLAQTLNVSVPSYTVADALNKKIIYSQVLTNPTYALALTVYGASLCGVTDFSLSSVTVSSVDCAVQLRPDTILVSLGSNDALQALTFGAPPTDPIVFKNSYDDVMDKLKRTGARIILANVPDVTATPYLWTRASFTEHCSKPPSIDGNYFVVNLVDPTLPSGDICTNYSMRPDFLVAAAQAAVVQYNVVIGGYENKDTAVVDINGLFKDATNNGVCLDDKKVCDKKDLLTTKFLGGLFSLDGLHPSNTGYAVMANKTIETINGKKWGITLTPVSLKRVANKDPLVPNN